MNYVVQFQINIFALMILLSLYLFMRTSKVNTFSKRMMRHMTLVTAIGIIVEPLTWIFDGQQYFGAYFLEYATNFMSFLLGPIIGGFFLSYVDYTINQQPRRIKRRLYYQHASVVTFVLLLINFFYPIYFLVDPIRHSYREGNASIIHHIILVYILAAMAMMTLKHIAKLRMREIIIFLFSIVILFSGIAVQMVDSKLHFVWSSMVLCLFTLYVFLETIPNELDGLTGLYNRKSFDITLDDLVHKGQTFSLLMIDLDKFKQVNDQFGHIKGDQVLMFFSMILQHVFMDTGMVFRLGGDEYAVILYDHYEEDSINEKKEVIKDLIKNHTDEVMKQQKFSFGYMKYDPSMTIDMFYHTVDQRMYKNKVEVR